jgi:hypothetical protein
VIGYLLVPEMDCEQLPREYDDGTCTRTLPIRLEATGTSWDDFIRIACFIDYSRIFTSLSDAMQGFDSMKQTDVIINSDGMPFRRA